MFSRLPVSGQKRATLAFLTLCGTDRDPDCTQLDAGKLDLIAIARGAKPGLYPGGWITIIRKACRGHWVTIGTGDMPVDCTGMGWPGPVREREWLKHSYALAAAGYYVLSPPDRPGLTRAAASRCLLVQGAGRQRARLPHSRSVERIADLLADCPNIRGQLTAEDQRMLLARFWEVARFNISDIGAGMKKFLDQVDGWDLGKRMAKGADRYYLAVAVTKFVLAVPPRYRRHYGDNTDAVRWLNPGTLLARLEPMPFTLQTPWPDALGFFDACKRRFPRRRFANTARHRADPARKPSQKCGSVSGLHDPDCEVNP